MNQTGHGRLWQRVWSVGLLVAVTLFLHGCAGKYPVGLPTRPAPPQAPVSSAPGPSPAPPQAPVSAPVPAPVPAPEPYSSRESVPVPEEGKAAGTLLASARQNVRSGEFGQAAMILERALRVEPRNARLWHEMAQVKYGQKDYGQVVQLCIKSNSLAGKDYGLIRQNWLLMEKAYQQLGEPEKARQARVKSG